MRSNHFQSEESRSVRVALVVKNRSLHEVSMHFRSVLILAVQVMGTMPQSDERGMLKLLLGHWKAHRKRPQLLPENGDIHFEDPSTVNPLYEDSEASADSSLKQTEGSLIAVESSALKTETPDGQNNKGTSDVTALVDVSVPQALNEPAPQDSKESTSPTHEITSPIRLKEPSDNSKDSPDTFINPAELKESLGNSKNSPDTSVNPDKLGGSSDSSKEIIDTSSKPISVEKATNSPNEVFDGNQNVKSFYQPKATEVSKPSTSQNLPQTSFLHDGQISNTSMNVKKEESSPISVSTNDQKSKKRQQSKLHAASENDRKPRDKSNSKKTNTLENNEHIASQNNTVHTSGSSTKENPSSSNNTKNSPGKERFKVKEDKSPSPPVTESVPETKKKPKFRARAIDELIKKFQGSPHDDEISTKTEISSPKKGFSVTKTEESKTTPIKNSNEENLEKESLSKIFKFPPPPPTEPSIDKENHQSNLVENQSTNNLRSAEIANAPKQGNSKTKSDSSLTRNSTPSASVHKVKAGKIQKSDQVETNIKENANNSKPVQAPSAASEGGVLSLANSSKTGDKIAKTLTAISKEKLSSKEVSSLPFKDTKTANEETAPKVIRENSSHAKNNPVSISKNLSSSPKGNSKQKVIKQVSNLNRRNSGVSESNCSPERKMTTSISNTNADTAQTRENDIHKPPSEDSGITRGDQISSEATAEPTPSVLPSTENPVPPSPVKRNRKERRSRHSHSKNCRRHSRRSQEERSAALKRGQCDEYYDGLTGARRFHKGRHSDSWTSDLSWEEKELLRRLRSRRGTVRSNAPSARSARSHQWKQDEGHFHRPQPFRRSVSDESTFFGSSVCSCDDCWAFFMKDYAYGRASLRGIPATQELCTCRMVRPDFLGRRVQFCSETIHEASQSERTVTTPTMTENKDGGTEDDVTSNLSAKKKDEEPQKLPNGITEKKSKIAEENYRFVTPWELEEWDLAMKRHLLHRRRRRARCMGIMALAMVVFIGLVVAVVMIYLRRKVI